MKNFCLIQNHGMDFFFFDPGVCSWFSCKRERSLSIFRCFYKRKCRKKFLIQKHSVCLNIFFFQYFFQKFSMHIFSCFSKKSCAGTKFCRRNCHVCRSSAWVLCEYCLSFLIDSLPGKINQDLTKCCNIITRFFCHYFYSS